MSKPARRAWRATTISVTSAWVDGSLWSVLCPLLPRFGDTGRVDLTGLVMREGVVARASGRVLVTDGTAWFEPPLAQALPAIFPPPPPSKSRYAVRVHGVDLGRLDRAKQHDGGILEGWTTLTGVWRQRELHVHAQTPHEPKTWTDRWTIPPCPPPATGWPTAPIHGPMAAANLPVRPPQPDEQAELTITQLTVFRPHPAQPVLVVAAEDPERAEQALRPRIGAALCVVRSRYSRNQVEETQRLLRNEMSSHRWLITSTGRSAGHDGQPTVTATFVWIEPEVAQWATTVPDGLLDLEVWLRPVE